MHKLREKFMKLDKVSKVKLVSILMVIVLAVSIALPTLARYKNRIDIESVLNSVNTWDGTIASSYHNGTGSESDPYIISDAREFAYFQQQLQSTDYTNTYFKLSNDIIINDGTFNYTNSNKMTYLLEDTTFYLKEYTSDIYSNEEMTGNKISSINKFDSLNNFKGYFDGDYNTVYGLYMTSDSENELGLFKNLSGTVENLYLENAMIYGGSFSAGLASSTVNATVKDVFVEGNVISTKNNGDDITVLNVDDYIVTKGVDPLNDTLVLPTYSKDGIKSIKLKGEYSSTENQTLVINGTEITPGNFNIDLGTSLLNSVEIKVDDDVESIITLSNITYEITYAYGISSGVVAKATSTNLKNIINKANVYGSYDASGLVGIINSSNLNSAYNNGKVTAGGVASGLIGSVKNSDHDLIVSKTYNTGELVGASTNSFVNEISNNKIVSISNVFNIATANNNISSINQGVSFVNVYDVNQSNVDGITQTTAGALKNKSSLTTMGYNEYVDSINLDNNQSNAWIYEKNSFPILYFDDLNNPLANLHVGTYSWNDISYELKDTYFSKGVAFSIEAVDELNPVEAYYYIHKEKTSLTNEQIRQITDWVKYEDVVSLNEEGYFVIYAKVVDADGYTNYINSEQLIIDLTSPEVELTMNDKTWNDFRSDLSNINIYDSTNLLVTSSDEYSEIKSSKYYVSNSLLTEEELNDLEDWEEYSENIALTSKGTYVVNVRVEDDRGHVTYVNSDYIVFGGYEEVLTLGRNGNTSLDKVNITDKSSITYNFKYENETSYEEGYINSLITNVLLPKNTYMTLIDNVNNSVYSYKVKTNEDEFGYEDSCNEVSCKFATYPLSLFTMIGQTNDENIFDDEKYLENNNKDLTLIIDFSNTNISDAISLRTLLEISDDNGKVILSTLKSSIKDVNIYPSSDASLVLTNKSVVDSINLISDSTTTINFETYLVNKDINSNPVYDVTLENKKLALAVKLVDSSDNIVEKRYLKNIKFKVGDKYYSPDNDGIVRIKLSDGLDKFDGSLIIETISTNSMLETGNYNFIITPYLAADGKYGNDMINDSIIVPATTIKKEIINFGFNVLMNDANKIIYKKDQTTNLNLKFISINSLDNSNIRMSLYKKVSLSGVDQTYEIVDLQDYVVGQLTKIDNNIYQVTNNSLNLSFNNSKFDNIGYELRFELYDSNNRVTTIKKKFIVR